MNVYRRYFEAKKGALVDEVLSIIKIQEESKQKIKDVAKSIGANQEKWLVCRGKVCGFFFESDVDMGIYKSVDNGCFMPKKNTKIGKDVYAKLKLIPQPQIDDALSVVSLDSHFMGGVHDSASGRIHFPSLIFIPSTKVVFVSKPWYDEDPKKIEEYRDNEGSHDSNMDSILWEPSSDMVEVKEWQMKKAISDHNESIK